MISKLHNADWNTGWAKVTVDFTPRHEYLFY